MITQEQVKHLFNYNLVTGDLTWKTRRCNRAVIGGVAGTLAKDGYIVIRINGSNYKAHRLIFLLFNGRFPKESDHIDGNRANNRIENIRECTPNQNQYNKKISKSNTSGIKGVYWSKKSKKWHARIKVDGFCLNLGFFNDIEVAAQVVRIERLRLHKEFANHG